MRKLLLIALLPLAAMAQPVLEANFMSMHSEHNSNEVRNNVVGVSAGYQFNVTDNFSITPLLGVAKSIKKGAVNWSTPISDGTYIKKIADEKMKLVKIATVRAQYRLDSGMYAFVQDQYFWEQKNDVYRDGNVNLHLKNNVYGAGIGYQFSDNFGANLSVSKFHDGHILGANIQLAF